MSMLAAQVALANQVIGQLDLVLPGLDGCFSNLLGARAGRVIVTDICDPDRIRRLGVEGLRRFVARRGVALSSPSGPGPRGGQGGAVPAGRRAGGAGVGAGRRRALLSSLDAQIVMAEAALGEVLADTPRDPLTSLPGVAVVRASNYGAGIGDPARFTNAAAAYRASGLVPAPYESPGPMRERGCLGPGVSVFLGLVLMIR
jgi:hypothetical protein